MELRGLKQARFAAAIGHSRPWVNVFLKKEELQSSLIAKAAKALDLNPELFMIESDEEFRERLQQALESPDPTAPDPEPPEDRVAGEHRGALVRSLPIETFLHPGGLVDGSLAIDVITRPSGKSGELLKKKHAQRSDRRVKTPYVEIEGVPLGCELVRAEATVPIRDEDPEQVIPRGFLLIVDRQRKPEPGQLVIAVRNVDARLTEEMPAVRLLRYHQAGRGWSLAEVDGSDKTYGSGDGWEVVAAVLWWRSPP